MLGKLVEALAEYSAVSQDFSEEDPFEVRCRNDHCQAIVLRQLGRYEEALAVQERLSKIADISEESRFNWLNSLGHTFWRMGRYQDAAGCFQQVLEWSSNCSNPVLQATAHNNLGLVYSDMERLDEARDQHQRSLHLRMDFHDSGAICTSYLNLGNVMVQLDDFDSGLGLWEKALGICKRLGDKATEAMIENNMGEVSYKKGDYPKAAAHFYKSLKMKEELNLRSYLDTSLEGLAKTYYEMRDQPGCAEQCRHFGQLLLALDTARPQKRENVTSILAALDAAKENSRIENTGAAGD
jgi:G-protein signaling modulator 2